MLIDTHAHIHEADYPESVDEVIEQAAEEGVSQIIVVGTSLKSSAEAIQCAAQHPTTYASIGVHPHDTKDGYDLTSLGIQPGDCVAVGEIGLDYFYTHSSPEIQKAALRAQLSFAAENNLPVIFHVRDAFDDFWPIYDEFPGIKGVLHSFTDNDVNLQKALKRGLYIGVNGISTFTKDPAQQAMFDAIPLKNLVFETDAPFLTPVPFRGKINKPGYVRHIAQYHADRRGISLDDIAAASTHNARLLFQLPAK